MPEIYTAYEPQQVLEDFTEEFRRRYNVECVSALHHNKKKTNYHIHLIFSERRLLAEPDIKIATRSVFYDETGKRVRTKKEIADENGKIIGAHIFGAHAADLVQEVSALMNRETTVAQLKEMIHAHPTLSEILQECAREF